MFKFKQQTVNLWFKGETEPTLDNARTMAIRAKVQLDWLMTGRPPKSLEAHALRPKVQQLVMLAEPQSDYVLDQLIKIVPALVEPAPDGNGGSGQNEAPQRQKNRSM